MDTCRCPKGVHPRRQLSKAVAMRGTGSHFAKVDYSSLNAKQKEVHNFHHIAAVLARHGYASYPIGTTGTAAT